MKEYQKPQINLTSIKTNVIASLNDWLSENSLTDAGITTYIVNS